MCQKNFLLNMQKRLPFYKGEVKKWEDVPEHLYEQPYYEDNTDVSEEAQQYLFNTTDYFIRVRDMLKDLTRKLVKVNIIKILYNCINIV